jgi:hypothetical protein
MDAKKIVVFSENNKKPLHRKRVFIETHDNLSEEKVPFVDQKEHIRAMYLLLTPIEEGIQNKIRQEIKKKIGGYKHQDQIKHIYDSELFVDFDCILQRLYETNMSCFYCSCDLYIFYNQVREKYQWTVDRVDNSKGHNKDNFVLSCFACNIKRRCQQLHKFHFTKNLVLQKVEN